MNLMTKIVIEAETAASTGDLNKTLAVLRKLSLQEFGEIFISMPNPRFPHLSNLLPRMASAETQRNWTGNDGLALLNQTNSFINLLGQHIDLKSVKDVLDFGCGYGRIMRAMCYYIDPDHLHGCDPWDVSIDLCKDAGVLGHLEQSEYLPTQLPFDRQFDLIYAFSVFTHLSRRATIACLDALIKASSGVIAITIRPVNYWEYDTIVSPTARKLLTASHKSGGFAFNAHQREPIDGDITYGDSSFSTDWLKSQFPTIEIMSEQQIPHDDLQTLILLRKKHNLN